jgi:hypothetical protein
MTHSQPCHLRPTGASCASHPATHRPSVRVQGTRDHVGVEPRHLVDVAIPASLREVVD